MFTLTRMHAIKRQQTGDDKATLSPVSSLSSRRAASAAVSPLSMSPAGNCTGRSCVMPRCNRCLGRGSLRLKVWILQS